MQKVDFEVIEKRAKILRGVGLTTPADDHELLIARVRELEAIIEATAREMTCVHIDADHWVCTNDDETGEPWLVMHNNEAVGDAADLWAAIEAAKGAADA